MDVTLNPNPCVTKGKRTPKPPRYQLRSRRECRYRMSSAAYTFSRIFASRYSDASAGVKSKIWETGKVSGMAAKMRHQDFPSPFEQRARSRIRRRVSLGRSAQTSTKAARSAILGTILQREWYGACWPDIGLTFCSGRVGGSVAACRGGNSCRMFNLL